MKKLLTLLFLIPLITRAAIPPIIDTAFITHAALPTPSLNYLNHFFDDTEALQAQMNDGNVTLSKAVYSISSTLTNTYNLYLGGNTIVYTGTGEAINEGSGLIHGPGVITGNSNTNNSDGPSGIGMTGANTAVVGVTITNFQSYGIYGGANNPKIDSCHITNIGYLGYLYYANGNTTGGTFTHNVVDESMIIAPTQKPVEIEGSVDGSTIAKKWVIAYNTIKTSLNPADIDAECMEVRWVNNAKIYNNTFTGGSIGLSLVAMKNLHIHNNKAYNCSNEGYEFAGVTNGYSSSDYSTGGPLGFLMDGNAGSNITVTGFTCNNVMGFQIYTGISGVAITNANVTCTSQSVYITNATNVTVTNPTFNGQNQGDFPITIESSPGGFVMNGGNITGFNGGLVNATGGSPFVISNVNTNDVVLTKTASGLGLYNATVGINVSVQ